MLYQKIAQSKNVKLQTNPRLVVLANDERIWTGAFRLDNFWTKAALFFCFSCFSSFFRPFAALDFPIAIVWKKMLWTYWDAKTQVQGICQSTKAYLSSWYTSVRILLLVFFFSLSRKSAQEKQEKKKQLELKKAAPVEQFPLNLQYLSSVLCLSSFTCIGNKYLHLCSSHIMKR